MKRKAAPAKKRILSWEQVQRLRSVCDTNIPRGKRDLAFLDTMLYQGMRSGEVENLKLEYIRKLKDQYFIQMKRRPKPIKAHTEWLQSLNDWLNQRGVSLENNRGPMFLQVNKFDKSSRKPLGKRMISYLDTRYGNLAGIAPMKGVNRLFPIDLRRTCARNAYNR